MRVLLVVNPAARGVDRATAAATTDRWSAQHELTRLSSHRRNFDEQLRTAIPGTEAVAVLGGDGMLNRVANVLADLRSDATLVPLPGGTTNVVARTIGLPRRLDAANEAALAALAAGATARRGWGRLNGHGFLANAGVGFDAGVVRRVEANPARKARLGHLWFAAAAAREAWTGPRQVRLHAQLPIPDPAIAEPSLPAPGIPDPGTSPRNPDDDAFWVLAMASHPYSYAGSRALELLRADRVWGDGLWMVQVQPASITTVARLAVRLLSSNRGIADADGVGCHKLTGEITYRSALPVAAQTDGESLEPACSFTFRWQPDALRLIEPEPRTGTGTHTGTGTTRR